MKTAREYAEEHFRDSDDWDSLTASYQAALQAQHEATWAMAIEAFKQKCRDQQERRPEDCKWEQRTYAYLERFTSDLACPPLQTTNEE